MSDLRRGAAEVATIIGTVVAVATYFRDAPPQSLEITTPPAQVATCSPSFDCARDRRRADRIVCETVDLCERDRALDALYQRLRATSDKASRARLRESQRQWWTYRRNICSDADCLRRAYDGRIRTLKPHVVGHGT